MGSSPEQVKTRIAGSIAALIGKALWKCTRAADLASFHFGGPVKVRDFFGNDREVGEYALHVQCAWRITRNDHVVVGSRDLYYSSNLDEEESPENFDWDHGRNRRDVLLDKLFEGSPGFTVQSLEVGRGGGVNILLDAGLSLELFPDDSLSDEHWRLLRPATEEPHFVVSGKGVQEDR